MVLLVCAACSPAVTDPEAPLSETLAIAPEQQPLASLDEIGAATADTNIETSASQESHLPGEPPGQSDQRPATQEKTADTATNQNDTPTVVSNSTAPSLSTENQGSAAAPPTENNNATTAPPAENNNAVITPPAENNNATTVPPAENNNAANATPAENNVVNPAAQVDESVILTISGNGVNGTTAWTLDQLQALRDGYRELTYSTTNNWPNFEHMEAHGISIPYLLKQAGLRSNAASIKFISTDGYFATLTFAQVSGTRYSYASHSAAGSSGASAVEPVVAWAWGNVGKTRQESIRPFFGQSGPWDVNTAAFVKNLCKIEVSTASAGTWAGPGASITDGSTVPAGTELELSHSNMDSIRIYYTLDGSEPGYNSPVYNQSASYFQPQLIKPLVLTKSVTVKAFAAGLGKERSPTVTFSIVVE